MSDAEYENMTVVFYGQLSEATILRSALEAGGFTIFMEDENMQVMEPVATGGSPLGVRLLARNEDLEDVMASIEELRSGKLALPDED